MLLLQSIETISNDILSRRQAKRNFPKTIRFPFDTLYCNIVTQISTIELSSECILFNSVQAVSATRDFSDPAYWPEGYSPEDIARYWFFAQNGQGDLWLMDTDGKVYFYDHNQEQMSREHLFDLELNFGQWLRFAALNKQMDLIFDNTTAISAIQAQAYKQKLKEISPALSDRYPFEI